MLNNDILRLIYEECSLESCLALGEACKASSEVLASMARSLIRQKVQRRAPWFELSRTNSSWLKCARVVVSRSRRARYGEPNIHIVENLSQVTSNSFMDIVSVKPIDMARNDNLRRNMKPLFPSANLANIATTEESVVKGTKLLRSGQELDLSSMLLDVSDYDPAEVPVLGRKRKSVFTTPTGLKVRHRDGIEVEVVAENANLLQVQYYLADTEIDEIVHKASQPRDEDGIVVLDPDLKAPRIEPSMHSDIGMVNLAPGLGGALLIQHYAEHPEKSYLGYIEPTPERSIIELCKIPRQVGYPERAIYLHEDGFDKSSRWFYVPYNGYIYIYFHGRFIQLWVDLNTAEKPLTVWNSNFPAIGPFGRARETLGTWEIAQGAPKDGLERYITIEYESLGCVVGDLKTGRTFFSRPTGSLTIPVADGPDSIGFYIFSEKVWQFIEVALDSFRGKDAHIDISRLYADCTEKEIKKGTVEEDQKSHETAEEELCRLVGYFPSLADAFERGEDVDFV